MNLLGRFRFFDGYHFEHTDKCCKDTNGHDRHIQIFQHSTSHKRCNKCDIANHCANIMPQLIIMMPFFHYLSDINMYPTRPKHIIKPLARRYNIKQSTIGNVPFMYIFYDMSMKFMSMTLC